jgi:hypothetical protein
MAGYEPQKCLDNLSTQGLVPPGTACQNLTPSWHCDDITNQSGAYHTFCAKEGIYYQPVQCLVCTNKSTGISKYFPPSTFYDDCDALHDQDKNWKGGQCYCCCSCFANDTLIAIPNGNKQIYLISKGDQVLAASVASTGDKIQMSWSTAEVTFSSGTDKAGQQPMMVYISLIGKDAHELICNMDQPFLLADGKYTTAGKLRPDQQLVDKDGNPVTVKLVSIGSYEGGVHHISTDKPWHKNPDGHLLLAGGVVAGDYTLQMYFAQLPDSMKEDNYNEKPTLGTSHYEATHAGKVKRSDVLFEFVGANSESKQIGQRQMVSGLFKTYSVETSNVPYGAAALFTPEQAADIAMNGSQAPLSNPIALSIFNTIKAQLAGFFPDVNFYYDTFDMTSNLYAFEAYGQKIVQVSGGLARMKGFTYEGMFMAMAHGVSCFYGGDPKNGFGCSAVGQADWYAFGVISRICWIGDPYLTYVVTAMDQWKAIFALVSPEHAKGNPLDPLNDPSLNCRIKTIKSAAAGGALPECAGGAPLPKISLQKATAASDTDVVLNLSLAVDNDSGTNVSNYTLTPDAKVTSATLDAATGFIVHLKVDMKPDTQYEVKVQDLVSILGTGLDPNHVSTIFKTPKD